MRCIGLRVTEKHQKQIRKKPKTPVCGCWERAGCTGLRVCRPAQVDSGRHFYMAACPIAGAIVGGLGRTEHLRKNMDAGSCGTVCRYLVVPHTQVQTARTAVRELLIGLQPSKQFQVADTNAHLLVSGCAPGSQCARSYIGSSGHWGGGPTLRKFA